MEGVGDEVLLFGAATLVGAVMLYYAVSDAIRQQFGNFLQKGGRGGSRNEVKSAQGGKGEGADSYGKNLPKSMSF